MVEEEKTIDYRFFDDVPKTRSMPSRVYRGDGRRLCFRKWQNFFTKKFPAKSPSLKHHGDRCALALAAVEDNAGVMDGGAVLYDGKAKPRAAEHS